MNNEDVPTFKIGDLVYVCDYNGLNKENCIVLKVWCGNDNQYERPAGYYVYRFNKKTQAFFWLEKVKALK